MDQQSLPDVRIETPDRIADPGALSDILYEYLTSASDALTAAGGPQFDIAHQVALTVENADRYLPPRGYTFLAYGGAGDLVGVACLKMIRPDVAEVKRLYVRPATRGTGLGRQLMDQVVVQARALGAAALYLDTVKTMTAAIRMYETMGFRPIARYVESENPRDVWPFAAYLALDL